MKLGLIISMYNEIDVVRQTINNIREDISKIIVIQSDPSEKEKILDSSLVDNFELLPDIALSQTNYLNERKGGLTSVPARALSRNANHGFQIAATMDIDWWIFIFGDVSLSNLRGIKKIIKKLIKENKSLAITRPVGQTLYDSTGNLTNIITENSTTFTPTFFIVHSLYIKKGLFTNIAITNPYASEQCFGDNLNEFYVKNEINFQNSTYFISNNAYPNSIVGLKYNYPQSKFPGLLRRFKKTLTTITNNT